MQRTLLSTAFVSATTLGVVLQALPAASQCSSCAQPVAQAVAYQPVAYQPTVYQSTTTYGGWYPGKLIGDTWRSLFGAQTTSVYTANYAAPVAYGASYAPYTASYAPYTAGYVPYAASYAPAATVAYRPTYPPTYTVGYAPTYSLAAEVPLQTVVQSVPDCGACATTAAMPVTLAAPCCDACGGVATAGYAESGGCASCEQPASFETPYVPQTTVQQAPGATPGYQSGSPTPAPILGADENVPEERSNLKPDADKEESAGEDLGPTDGSPADESSTYFEAPRLFNPGDRTTRKPTAPVWKAVYRKPVGGTAAVATGASVGEAQPETDRRPQVGYEGWSSVPKAER